MTRRGFLAFLSWTPVMGPTIAKACEAAARPSWAARMRAWYLSATTHPLFSRTLSEISDVNHILLGPRS